MVIICPKCGDMGRVDDPDYDFGVCAVCGCIFEEIEDEESEDEESELH